MKKLQKTDICMWNIYIIFNLVSLEAIIHMSLKAFWSWHKALNFEMFGIFSNLIFVTCGFLLWKVPSVFFHNTHKTYGHIKPSMHVTYLWST
jgi:hypothetical protein